MVTIIKDSDLADINIKVAEQCLIKASIEDNEESQIRALIFAKKSIENALNFLGAFDNNIETKRGLSKNNTNLQNNK